MSAHLLVDNWTLQCVAEFLADGLRGEVTSELLIAPDKNNFSYHSVSADLVRVRCLFQLLDYIVLSDEILVDGPNAETWSGEVIFCSYDDRGGYFCSFLCRDRRSIPRTRAAWLMF